jgi:hypothetical protein
VASLLDEAKVGIMAAAPFLWAECEAYGQSIQRWPAFEDSGLPSAI